MPAAGAPARWSSTIIRRSARLDSTSLLSRIDTVNRKDRVLTLILSCNDLERLPREFFFAFPKLQELDISHNLLEELPAEICLLPNLWRLRLESNRLRELPPSLGKCRSPGSGLSLCQSVPWDSSKPTKIYYLLLCFDTV